MSAVVVVGGGLGGWRTATELRRLGHAGRLTVIGAEAHRPYDRPPLSKRVLAGVAEPHSAYLDDADSPASLDSDLRTGVRATSVAPGIVETSTGRLPWDTLVVATGGEPRRPAFVPRHPRVHVLRTLDDAVALRADLLASASLVVVGGGFIGMEVAAAARSLGLRVTLVEAQPTLAQAAVGVELGQVLADVHRDHGVDVRAGAPVTTMSTSDDRVEVVLGDGTTLVADLAVVGLGIVPATGVLGGLGLDLSDGVLCDREGRVAGLDGAWAVGDVARWADGLGGTLRREHWTTTADQASIVAHAVLGLDAPDHLRAPPYVWSDQHGLKVQQLGRPDLADAEGWLERNGSSGCYGYHRGEDLVAVATIGIPRLLAPYRRPVAEGLAALRGRTTAERAPAEV
ncbi:FAD/NAD(P)-binding oxidoreductase [soil metagenome]